MKSIDTLVEDIYAVVQGRGGWNAVISKEFRDSVGDVMDSRLSPDQPARSMTGLRMSSIGQPCKRKLWYSIHQTSTAQPMAPANLLKFLQGDLLESVLISLAKAAGHTVTGEQTVLYCDGVRGSRDCVIDGVTVDVKTASAAAMKKFVTNSLRTEDPFGYIRQLAGYVKGAADDPLVLDKKRGAFLAIDKANGTLVLDMYDLTEEINSMEEHIEGLKTMLSEKEPPARSFEDVPEGKSGNYKLDTPCVFCDFKKQCWPDVRAFKYSWGVIYLTKVVREPDKRIEEVPV